MNNLIKKYLEQLAETNEELKAHYDESKMDKCMAYIYSEAYKLATRKNNVSSTMADDKTVYQWAVDYYLADGNVEINDKFNPEAKKTVVPPTPVVKTEVVATPVVPAVKKKGKEPEYEQVSLF